MNLKEILHRWLHISGCEESGRRDAGDCITLHQFTYTPMSGAAYIRGLAFGKAKPFNGTSEKYKSW